MTKTDANLPSVATEIRRARGARTQAEFAHIIGCARQTVADWEDGRTKPSRPGHVVALHAEGVPAIVLDAPWLEFAAPTHPASA